MNEYTIMTRAGNDDNAFLGCLTVIARDYYPQAVVSISNVRITRMADGRSECKVTLTYNHDLVEKIVSGEL